MQDKKNLCFSLAAFMLLFSATCFSAEFSGGDGYAEAIFSGDFAAMNIPAGDGTFTPQSFEKTARYLLARERFEWLAGYLDRAPKGPFSDYAAFRVMAAYGQVEPAREKLLQFAETLIREYPEANAEAVYNEELAFAFAWLRKHEFDGERLLLDRLIKAFPANYALAAERLRWIDWLDGRPAAGKALEKIEQDDKSSYALLAEAAAVPAEWDDKLQAARLLLAAWQKAESGEEIAATYKGSVAVDIPALEKKLAGRILKKLPDIDTLAGLYNDRNISSAKIVEYADSLLRRNNPDSMEIIAAAELLLKTRERKKAVELAERSGGGDSIKKLLAEARLMNSLLSSEVEQDKFRLYSEKRLDAIRRLSAAPELKATSAYRLGALITPEKRDAEIYRLLRPHVDKLRGAYSGLFMQLQELRLLLQAGQNAEVQAGLDSLYQQYSNKPLLQAAVISEAVRFIQDGLEDLQDGRLRKWCLDRAMACSDASKDNLLRAICADILDRLSKRAEALSIRQKIVYEQNAPTELILELNSVIQNGIPREQSTIMLTLLEKRELSTRQKIILMSLLFRCDEQEKATALKYSLSSSPQSDNLALARRLVPYFEKFRNEIDFLTSTGRISLDVFSHQIIMLLRKHRERTSLSDNEIAEFFSILRRMYNDRRADDFRRDSETRFFLWKNAGAIEDAIHDLFESLPAGTGKIKLPEGVAAELGKLNNGDFLEVLSSGANADRLTESDLRALLEAAMLRGPNGQKQMLALLDNWKTALTLEEKAAAFFDMARTFKSASDAVRQLSVGQAQRYQKTAARLEKEIEFISNWKSDNFDPERRVINRRRLLVSKDPRQHILSAAEVEAAVAANAEIIERCFEHGDGAYSPEFSGFVVTDAEGFVANTEIYDLNSNRDLQNCIKERLFAIYIEKPDPPFAYARLRFNYTETAAVKNTDDDDSRVRLAELERLKSSVDQKRRAWAEWSDQLAEQSERMLQLASDISNDSGLQKKIAAWQFINGQEEEARRTLRLAIWTQVGHWLGIMAALLAALWIIAYIRKRDRKE